MLKLFYLVKITNLSVKCANHSVESSKTCLFLNSSVTLIALNLMTNFSLLLNLFPNSWRMKSSPNFCKWEIKRSIWGLVGGVLDRDKIEDRTHKWANESVEVVEGVCCLARVNKSFEIEGRGVWGFENFWNKG